MYARIPFELKNKIVSFLRSSYPLRNDQRAGKVAFLCRFRHSVAIENALALVLISYFGHLASNRTYLRGKKRKLAHGHAHARTHVNITRTHANTDVRTCTNKGADAHVRSDVVVMATCHARTNTYQFHIFMLPIGRRLSKSDVTARILSLRSLFWSLAAATRRTWVFGNRSGSAPLFIKRGEIQRRDSSLD